MMKLNKIAKLPKFKSIETTLEMDFISSWEESTYQGSQAPCPVVNPKTGNLEVWFSARDLSNKSYPFKYVLNDKLEVISTEGPLAELGKPGEFDADGFMPSQVYYDEMSRLNGFPDWLVCNYTGWNDGNSKVRYRTACGYNTKKSRHIEIDRNNLAPCGSSMPFEIEISGRYTTFYMAYKYWEDSEPMYTICYSVEDYFSTELSLSDTQDCLARPTVLVKDGRNYLFYSSRSMFNYRKEPSHAYKLRVAELDNNLEVVSNDYIEMERDPLMDAYMYPIEYNGRTLAFWNAGGFRSPIVVGELTI